MKKLTKTVATFILGLAIFTSCNQSQTEDVITSSQSTELSSEEIDTAIETMAFKYNITALADDDSEIIISNDEELSEYSHNNSRPRIEFPIDITIDGETITVNNKEELKALVGKKERAHREPPFELVFPVTVSAESGDLEIADEEAMKTYMETLEKGTHPAFVFPISILMDEETIVINDEEELKALKPEKGSEERGDREQGEKPLRPEMIFPISVTTESGDIEIADEEAMKTYMETLEKGTHPTFVFPISFSIDEETVVVNDEEELKALFPKKNNRENGGPKGGRK